MKDTEVRERLTKVIVEGTKLPPLIIELVVRGGMPLTPELSVGLLLCGIQLCRTQGLANENITILTKMLQEIIDKRVATATREELAQAEERAMTQVERLKPYLKAMEERH